MLHTGFLVLNTSHFSVYHLHGSLNWEIIRDKINIDVGAITPQHNRLGSNLCLVPPGQKELNPVLKSIWATAEERLLKADELIIIGCSLNPEDIRLIGVIKKFVDKKGADNVKIIYLSNQLESDYQKGITQKGNTITYSPPDPSESNYDEIIGDGFKKYTYGFNINAPIESLKSIKPGTIIFESQVYKPGAIEFIFS